MSQLPLPDRSHSGPEGQAADGAPPALGPTGAEQLGGTAEWAYPRQPHAGGTCAGIPAYPGQQPHPGPALPPGYPGCPPGYPAPWPPPGYDPADPLVTLPGEGLSGWFSRCSGTLRRSWRLLLPVLALTHALPTLALLLAVVPLYPMSLPEPTAPGEPPAPLPDGYLGDLGVFFAAMIGLGCLLGFVQAVGWAAGTRVVARQAAGEPASVGAALAYGLRRAPALWGWTLVYGLLMLIGFVLCYLPGLYVMAALSLFGPVLLFERGTPLGRARQIFHARLGPVLGRITLVGLAASIASMVVAPIQFAAVLFADPADAASLDVWNVAYAVGAALVAIPAALVYLIGLVVTYAEQRAHEGPVTAARLAGELG
ncbi:hypothetical protein E1258_24580 [Micromonospora sp. KC207]|uniref:hypothetical protein n=1 Tax=Micromonospora sp. KC207 TaxID=2530377 RepID=UPI00104B380E|nr:hypothetical protein [Micromonospora sp. KC207]TDC53346.1 hypothetical protein E1258_24580 [Micromonospora sp. KC207]